MNISRSCNREKITSKEHCSSPSLLCAWHLTLHQRTNVGTRQL